MPFIPHTAEDIARMLQVIGAQSIDDLFDEIPPALKTAALPGVPPGLCEMEVARLLTERALRDGRPLNFIGAGAYEHHIPAPVWAIASRGEFYSAYTPYQAEASQGTLQLIYEYQSMMCALTAMEVSNASLYDGASALAEACLMAVRANRGSESRRILLPRTVNPTYCQVARNITCNQQIEFEAVNFDRRAGSVPLQALQAYEGQDFAALVVQQPDFLGNLEEVDQLTDWAHANKMLVIAVVNPTALALLKPPGEWGGLAGGTRGADIVCGEGQPLGRAARFGRALLRLHGDTHAVRAANARPNRRRDRGYRRPAGLQSDAAGAGAAHSAQQGDLQHMHQSRTHGDRGDDLHGAARRRRPEARGGGERAAHRGIGARAVPNRGRFGGF